MAWGNPQHKYRLGREWIETSPEEKDLGVLVQHDLAVCTHSPQSQPYPGLHQKKHGQQVDGGDSTALLCSGDTPSGVLPPALQPSAQERHGPFGVGPEEGHKNDQTAGTPLL